MRVGKGLTLDESQELPTQIRMLDVQLKRLVNAFQGRIRFGDGTDEEEGENIAGEFQLFTSDATPNTEFSVTHQLGAIPIGRIILYQDKAGSLYQGPSTGTAWTSTTVYFKCDVASVAFLVFLVK
jgi:hypothetical protein